MKWRNVAAVLLGTNGAKGARMYHGARPSRMLSGWAPATSSADWEIEGSLTTLRARSRALVRDSAYAKRARWIWQNNVIGGGMGLQARVMSSRQNPHKLANASIEDAWGEWTKAEHCHTAGALSFADLERLLIGEVYEAGEVFVRLVRAPFGKSKVPLALEVIESERVPHEGLRTNGTTAPNVRMGVELDAYQRPVAYWIRKRFPGDDHYNGGPDEVERVPAEDIIHLRLIDRWPQTRGVPAMHAALRTLNNMDSYAEAELDRARTQACIVGAIESSEEAKSFGEEQEDGSYELELQVGTIPKLAPGEKLNASQVTAPNPALDPFMRYMLRQVAAAIGVSYESLSRDYSQSNYSSSRLALLDDRDLWQAVQQWYVRAFRERLHRVWLHQALIAGALPNVSMQEYALNMPKFEAARFKARGWSWIDPKAEVAAYETAIRDGLTTRTAVIAMTAGGRDVEDIDTERAEELAAQAELGLEYDTDPVPPVDKAAQKQADAQAQAQAAEPADDEGGDEADDDAEAKTDERKRALRAVQ